MSAFTFSSEQTFTNLKRHLENTVVSLSSTDSESPVPEPVQQHVPDATGGIKAASTDVNADDADASADDVKGKGKGKGGKLQVIARPNPYSDWKWVLREPADDTVTSPGKPRYVDIVVTPKRRPAGGCPSPAAASLCSSPSQYPGSVQRAALPSSGGDSSSASPMSSLKQ